MIKESIPVVLLSSFLILISCVAPHYYPIEEIAFAEAALAAARDVNAQRLASDKYQFAVEELGKAKAAERSGQMGAAKRHARLAREWAEAAEERATMRLARVPKPKKGSSPAIKEESVDGEDEKPEDKMETSGEEDPDAPPPSLLGE